LFQVALAEMYGKKAGTLRLEQTRLKNELQDVNRRIEKARKGGKREAPPPGADHPKIGFAHLCHGGVECDYRTHTCNNPMLFKRLVLGPALVEYEFNRVTTAPGATSAPLLR